MPTYEADIEWIKQTHPEEYCKLPQELLASGCPQQHMGYLPDGPDGREMWVIAFAAPDDPSRDMFVELGIERPAPDTLPWRCKHHTLLVSRPLCPDCRDAETVNSTV